MSRINAIKVVGMSLAMIVGSGGTMAPAYFPDIITCVMWPCKPQCRYKPDWCGIGRYDPSQGYDMTRFTDIQDIGK